MKIQHSITRPLRKVLQNLARHSLTFHSHAFHGLARHGLAFHDLSLHSLARYGLALHSFAFHSFAFHDLTLRGLTRLPLVKAIACVLLALHVSLFFSSCSNEEEEVYPNVVTEMCDMITSAQGLSTQIILDDNTQYKIINTTSGLASNALYRVLCGYVPEGTSVRLYQLIGAHILRDSTLCAQRDPVLVRSVWRTPRYINLHLAPLTQGGTQYWGFITDSITRTLTPQGDTLTEAYLTLHHRQNGDPTSYTEELYASIPLDSIKLPTNQAVKETSTNQAVRATSANQAVRATSANQAVRATSANQAVRATSTNQAVRSASAKSTSTYVSIGKQSAITLRIGSDTFYFPKP